MKDYKKLSKEYFNKQASIYIKSILFIILSMEKLDVIMCQNI
ncbi:hypothetical protein BRSU_1879 [Brachyspira suanatina]|uniref:Uncharacterized protein n=1 Tax=Brachyspira suanatina TaxID=381802 RepID=A0A0G4K861_9SPIR|nr:hypothetical protein [Brachyspira suanatina]CRF34104.1 hypothetical protein BRSU_1879 [Brachyspira suanatina]